MAASDPLLTGLNSAVLQTFGREVTYLQQNGWEATLRAVFEPTREAEENALGIYAALFIPIADLPAPPDRGDEVRVDDATYNVFDIEADTSGGAILRLRQA
jgi:hypothetical protein